LDGPKKKSKRKKGLPNHTKKNGKIESTPTGGYILMLLLEKPGKKEIPESGGLKKAKEKADKKEGGKSAQVFWGNEEIKRHCPL